MSGHRRIVSESASPSRRLRPLSIFSTTASPLSTDLDLEKPPLGLDSVALLLQKKNEKVYHEGYLLKYDELTSDGSRIAGSRWRAVYAVLRGPILSTWTVDGMDNIDLAGILNKGTPSFCNITDARIFSAQNSHDIVLNIAGRNRCTLKAHPRDARYGTDQWLLALRLAMFERTRMQEIYTSNLYLKYSTKDTVDLPRKEEKWSGMVDVRVTGGAATQIQWRKMWCIVVNIPKRGFLTKMTSKDTHGSEAQIQLFSDKKDKTPEILLEKVFAAYSTYPEVLALVESAGMVKIEGKVHSARSSSVEHGFALMIPTTDDGAKRLSLSLHSSSAPQPGVQYMLKLLMAVWSVFDLYNMPRALLLNSDHVNALGTGDNDVDLKLEQVTGRLPKNLTSEVAWRNALREQSTLNSHYTQVRGKPLTPQSPSSTNGEIFRRIGNDRRVVSEGSIISAPRPLVLSIQEEEEADADFSSHIRSTTKSSRLSRSSNPPGHASIVPGVQRPLLSTTTPLTEDSLKLPIPQRLSAPKLPDSITTSNLSMATINIPQHQPLMGRGEDLVEGTYRLQNPRDGLSYSERFGEVAVLNVAKPSSPEGCTDSADHVDIVSSFPLQPEIPGLTSAGTIATQSFIHSPPRRPQERSDNERILLKTYPNDTNPPRKFDQQNAGLENGSDQCIAPAVRRSSSHASFSSDSSHYSDGLNNSALDLVRQYADHSSVIHDTDSTSEVLDTGRDGSVYSLVSLEPGTPEKPEVSRILAEYNVNNKPEYEAGYQRDFRELAAKIRRRASTVEALAVARNASLINTHAKESPNPHARARHRPRPDA